MKSQFTIEQDPKINYCPYKSISSHVCTDKNCRHNAFICSNQQCICDKDHLKCSNISVQSVKNTINAKIIPIDSFKDSIIEIIDKTIDKLSDFKDKIINQLESEFKMQDLTPSDLKFLNCLQTQNTQTLTGNDVSKVFNSVMTQYKMSNQIDIFMQKFTKCWGQINDKIDQKIQEIQEVIKLIKQNKLAFSAFLDLFEESKVITSEEIKENLLKMFLPQKIFEAKILYTASMHNFSTQKFHELCQNVRHTLTLCQTEHGKVIGGYTRLVWNKSNQYLRDESGTSFIFSLTNNHKFTLKQNKAAIHQSDTDGPQFGGENPDLYISNSANLGKYSWSKINRSYWNENYTAENKESWQKFNGDPHQSYVFKVNEWEVWQIKFN